VEQKQTPTAAVGVEVVARVKAVAVYLALPQNYRPAQPQAYGARFLILRLLNRELKDASELQAYAWLKRECVRSNNMLKDSRMLRSIGLHACLASN
jgi:hypothetical protein